MQLGLCGSHILEIYSHRLVWYDSLFNSVYLGMSVMSCDMSKLCIMLCEYTEWACIGGFLIAIFNLSIAVYTRQKHTYRSTCEKMIRQNSKCCFTTKFMKSNTIRIDKFDDGAAVFQCSRLNIYMNCIFLLWFSWSLQFYHICVLTIDDIELICIELQLMICAHTI